MDDRDSRIVLERLRTIEYGIDRTNTLLEQLITATVMAPFVVSDDEKVRNAAMTTIQEMMDEEDK